MIESHATMDRWKHLQDGRGRTQAATREQLASARDAAIICDLPEYALLSFEGEDAEAFLQGQLSSDVRALTADRCQLATYNSPKGRVLATLTLWRTDTGFLAQLPVAIAEAIRKRLSMYVLRAKVRIESHTDRLARIGVGGPDAERVLTAAGVPPPARVFDLVRAKTVSEGGRRFTIDSVMRFAGNRYELIVGGDESAVAIWRKLQECGAMPADFAAWRWLTLRAGIAEVGPQTQDELVAQMLNYELIGGISFDKGCYPGQEIVARTQFRGTIKRRSVLAHATDSVEPAPGTSIFSDASGDQAIGMVVNAAASPDGGHDLLMSVHIELASGVLHLGRPDGPRLQLMPMPYAIVLRA